MACGFIHHIVISCHCVRYGVTSHCNPLCVTGISDYAEIVEDEGDYSTPSGERTRQAPPSSKSLPLYTSLLQVSTALYTSLLQVSTPLYMSLLQVFTPLYMSLLQVFTLLYYYSLPSFPIDLYTLIHLLLYDISSLENFISFLNTSISIPVFSSILCLISSFFLSHSFYSEIFETSTCYNFSCII